MRAVRAVMVIIGLLAAACTGGTDGAGSEPNAPSTAPTTPPTTPPATTETAPATTAPPPPPAVYTEDFDGDVGEEWDPVRIDVTPAGGRTLLGLYGDETVVLQLDDLRDHDAVRVVFDLVVAGDWDGAAGSSHRWRLEVDGTRLINTTFANDGNRQSFPDNVPIGDHPAGTGAIERDTLGYGPPPPEPDPDGDPQDGAEGESDDGSGAGPGVAGDSTYRIERSFLHRGDQLTIAFRGRDLTATLPDARWALDDVAVELTRLPDRQPSTELILEVVRGRVTAEGTVPTEDDRRRVVQALGLGFEDRVDREAIEVGGDGPVPLWFYGIDEIVAVVAPSDDLRVELTERTVDVRGTIRTSAWRDVYRDRLDGALGPTVEPMLDVDIVFDDELVERLESLRVRFATGSAELGPADEAVLDEVLAILDGDERLTIRIDGHTDGSGEDQANRNLSGDRAQAAFDYLVGAGADPDRLAVRRRGDTMPEVPEVTAADRARNRRVTFVIPRG